MPSGSQDDVLDRIRSELTCAICLCPFDDPRILPCSHTFCRNCIASLHSHTSPVPSPSLFSLVPARPLTCPMCKRCCDMPRGGPNALPRNLAARAMVGLVDRDAQDGNTAAARSRDTREAPDPADGTAGSAEDDVWVDASPVPYVARPRLYTTTAAGGPSRGGASAGSCAAMPLAHPHVHNEDQTEDQDDDEPGWLGSVASFISENGAQIAAVAAVALAAGVAAYASGNSSNSGGNSGASRAEEERKRRERAHARRGV